MNGMYMSGIFFGLLINRLRTGGLTLELTSLFAVLPFFFNDWTNALRLTVPFDLIHIESLLSSQRLDLCRTSISLNSAISKEEAFPDAQLIEQCG